MKCMICGEVIPEMRLRILPKTQTCVQCSNTSRVYGHAIISGKTSYSEIQIVSEETAQQLFEQQNRKGSTVAEGVKFRQLPPPKLSNFE
ncbi:MAG: hypothetical protein SFY32_13830 [Bacteroidota bacterium]|nr:hypothetical protein [Bacteroidota bacterium]